jgi:hypothetical protein
MSNADLFQFAADGSYRNADGPNGFDGAPSTAAMSTIVGTPTITSSG